MPRVAFVVPERNVMTTLTLPPPTASPFDSIRQVRPDGSEFWSARDLMPLLGYDQWRRFDDAIDRAKVAIANSGASPDDHLADAGKMVLIGSGAGRYVQDYHLTRYGSYMTAQNSDPRKPEVAAAQTYFAVRTREAETRPAFDLTSLDGISAILDAGKAALNRAIAAEARAEHAETVVHAIETSKGLTPREFHKHYFSETPEREFFDRLYSLGLLIDQRGARGRDDRTGRKKNGHQHNHPAYKGKPYFQLVGRLDSEGERRESTRVRPGAPEVALAELLTGKGLPLNPNTLTATARKEIER